MPEKTRGAEGRPATADVLERFRKRVGDEPKHAAHSAKKGPPFLADAGDNHYGIGLDLLTGLEIAISFGHVDGKVALVRRGAKAENPSARSTGILPVGRSGILPDPLGT